jgi:urease accessory protein
VAIATLSTELTPRWAAELELSFGRRRGTTVIERRRHRGPLLVQRAFHPEDDGTCHVYVLHPPGGVAGGDELSLGVDVLEGASALLTTPAATKLYRTRGPHSTLRQTFRVRSGGGLEWLPQETLVFGGSNVVATTSVELDANASYLGWEITCLGRPASGDHFEKGRFRQCTEIRREGELVLVDRTHADAGGSMRSAAWGWAGRSVYATLVASTTSEALVTELRASVIPARPGDAFAVTALSGFTVCRWLGSSAEQARLALSAAWRILRNELFGKPACPPRIWTT